MNRLEQDAADTLEAYERMQEAKNRARADWEKAQHPEPADVWVLVHTEQQKQEQAQYIKQHSCPF